MAQTDVPTAAVDEWIKKSSELSSKNGDSLFSSVTRGFEAMGAMILKDSGNEKVHRALAFLNLELTLVVQFEKTKDDPLRQTVYVLLESLHFALNVWKEERNNAYETEENMMTVIEQWIGKSSEWSNRNGDSLFSAVSRAFEAMIALITKDSGNEKIQRALAFLNLERSLACQFEKIKNDSLRELVHGLLECIHLTLTQWTEERHKVQEEMRAQAEDPPKDHVTPKEEPEDSAESNTDQEGDIRANGERGSDQYCDTRSVIPNFTLPSRTRPKEEPTDISLPISDQLSTPLGTKDETNSEERAAMNGKSNFGMGKTDFPMDNSLDNPVVETMEEDKKKEEEEKENDEQDERNDEVHEPSVKKSRLDDDRNTKTAGFAIDNTLADLVNEVMEGEEKMDKEETENNEETERNDEVDEPSVKKSRSDDDGNTETKGKSSSSESSDLKKVDNRSNKRKDNSTELKCPECQFGTKRVTSWYSHLRVTHSTTPVLAGLALLCECGCEVLSPHHHNNQCEKANFTIIRKGNRPIRRLHYKKAAPPCIHCEMRPSTILSYIAHLRKHHATTLRLSGIYLKCACGFEAGPGNNEHSKGCKDRDFAIHKLNEE